MEDQMTYSRLDQWNYFDTQVISHIIQYTLPQYGGKEGSEQVENFSIEDCWTNIQRYYNRRDSSVRGNKEKLRDIIKVAHYAQFIYDKLKKELGEEDVY